MTTHTYSIRIDDTNMWVEGTYYTRSVCTCGIASGMTHRTLESARFHESDHVCIGTRNVRPTWDGDVVDTAGVLVHVSDLPMSDRASR